MAQVDYGIDKPERVRTLGMAGIVLVGMGLAQFIALREVEANWPVVVLSVCLWVGVLLIVVAGIMVWSSQSGKFGMAWKMIEDMNWTGKEKVLDVGCGRGLLTVIAARKLPLGNVVGIDIWSQEELSENSADAAMRNARLEQVGERVSFEEGDVREMKFSRASFDKVISSFALHAIGSRRERNQAVRDMVKVLKPGGQIALLDVLHTGEYVNVMEEAGIKGVQRSPMKFLYCLPTRYVIGYKPLMESYTGSNGVKENESGTAATRRKRD
jgi:arsenite methyltransferase